MSWMFLRYDSSLTPSHPSLHLICAIMVSDFGVLKFNGPPIPTSSIPIPQSVYHTVPESISTVCIPINDSSHLQVDCFNQYQEVYPMPTSVPTSMTAPMPIPHYHHYQQGQRLPYPPRTGVASPGLIARGRVSKACENCKFRKVKCSGVSPCERCAERALQCIYGERKVRGPTKKRMERRDAAVQQVSSASPAVSFCVSFVGFLLIFSRGSSVMFSRYLSSHPTPPSPYLSPPPFPYTHPYPHIPTPSPSPNPRRAFHSLPLPLLLPVGHYSRLSPLYPAPSSHRPLPRRPPSSAPQGRSPCPPPPSIKTTSLSLPLLNLLNQVIRTRSKLRRVRMFLRSSLPVPRGSRTKRFR